MTIDILTVRLRGPERPQPAGAAIPIEIEVRNVSRQSLWVVGVVDGSEAGIRYPHYLPRIVSEGRVEAQKPAADDPLIGPLRLTDFKRLDPGEAFSPTKGDSGAAYLPILTFTNFQPTRPGRYQFSLTLSTESDHVEQWLGRFGQEAEKSELLERLTMVPRVTVQSNTLEVEFV